MPSHARNLRALFSVIDMPGAAVWSAPAGAKAPSNASPVLRAWLEHEPGLEHQLGRAARGQLHRMVRQSQR